MAHDCHDPECKIGMQCRGIINTVQRWVGGGIARHPGQQCSLGATTAEGYCSHHVHQAPAKQDERGQEE